MSKMIINNTLESQIKKLPNLPGVYIFKDESGQIVYIGKAKSLKKRVSSYPLNAAKDFKSGAIIQTSTLLEHIITKSELEAMLLEAQLIQCHQPKFNITFKAGQPFLYIMVTQGSLPELKIVRTKKQRGTYFGPFLEKGPTRKVYDFLTKTFRLKLCKKKIENGCLYYHMGICAGKCKSDFNLNSYLERLDLAKLALTKDNDKYLEFLQTRIKEENKQLNFEKARELFGYFNAFQQIANSLAVSSSPSYNLAKKDIWILAQDKKTLFVFGAKEVALKKKQVFLFPFNELESSPELIYDYFTSYYRSTIPPANIIMNFDFVEDEKELLQQFLSQWHKKNYVINITHPTEGYFADLIRLATVQAQAEQTKQRTLALSLKTLLKLKVAPNTIDCFDISHKQGKNMVGSCVRFTNGLPDKAKFRHFHIRSISTQNDYAALNEIVKRRYKSGDDLPDLILIDGGKGQLSAVSHLYPQAEFASLAKKKETIFSKQFPDGKKLDLASNSGQLLTALRDYAHHFAISFHRSLSDLQ